METGDRLAAGYRVVAIHASGLHHGSPDRSSNATPMSGVLGTAKYMSPEQRAGQVTDKRIDIWAFGAVLYEMLTGSTPFEGGSDFEIDWSRLPPETPDAAASESNFKPLDPSPRPTLFRRPTHKCVEPSCQRAS